MSRHVADFLWALVVPAAIALGICLMYTVFFIYGTCARAVRKIRRKK